MLISLALIVSGLACIWDVRQGIIPNWLSYFAVLAAVLLSFFESDRVITDTVFGFIVGFVLPFFLFLVGRLGGGDVKLLAALGAALGFPLAVDLLLWTCVFGFFVAFIVVVAAGRFKELAMDILVMILVTFQQRLGRTEVPVSDLSIPLGVAIFISVCWLVFFPNYARLTAW